MPSDKKGEERSPTDPSNHEFIKKEFFHKALACRTRLKILAMLERKPMFGYELVRHQSMGQSAVSYHVGILKKAGLITAKPSREGTLYSLAKEGSAA